MPFKIPLIDYFIAEPKDIIPLLIHISYSTLSALLGCSQNLKKKKKNFRIILIQKVKSHNG